MIEFKNPWLIQRCTWNGIHPDTGMKFSDVLSLDYMGSSEFEWGAVPKCIRLMNSRMPLVVKEVSIERQTVFIVCGGIGQFEPYSEWLISVAEFKKSGHPGGLHGDFRLKEHINFWKILGVEKYLWEQISVEHLWLDLDNGVAFTFSRALAVALPSLIVGSVTFMDAKKVRETK